MAHRVGGSSERPLEDTSALDKKHTWCMRWVLLIAFILIFIGSLVVILVTNNSFLVSLPGSLLLFMRPIMRYLFGGNGAVQQSQSSVALGSSSEGAGKGSES